MILISSENKVRGFPKCLLILSLHFITSSPASYLVILHDAEMLSLREFSQRNIDGDLLLYIMIIFIYNEMDNRMAFKTQHVEISLAISDQ